MILAACLFIAGLAVCGWAVLAFDSIVNGHVPD